MVIFVAETLWKIRKVFSQIAVLNLMILKFNNWLTNWSYFRWGRVGERGQDATFGPFTKFSDAENQFKKKFQDKTKNKWENKDKFVPAAGKYTLLEMGDDEEEEEVKPVAQKADKPSTSKAKVYELGLKTVDSCFLKRNLLL